ncbi:MAG TPA: EamA family transporter [Solirubrobacteraceae bacterium]|nr:EamA family transporter [Solirubrobacteraceae bacterium]
MTIRLARPDDAPAIAHLAEVDEARVPAGELILAEVAGELWAAASVERDQGISDPFRPSGELLRALAERAGRRHRPDAGLRERHPAARPVDRAPGHDGRSHPPVVRVSADPAARRDVDVRREQDHAAVDVERPEHEHVRDERADLSRTEVDGCDDESAFELGRLVVRDLSGRAQTAELGTEVDRQLPGRRAGLGEGLDPRHPADPHVDREEVVEGDHGGRNIAGQTPPVWLAWLALITVYVVWGSTYLAIRVMVQTVPALLGAGARFLVAGLALYAWNRVRRRSGRSGAADRGSAVGATRRESAGAACVGILLCFGGNGLVTLAERHIASSLAALVIASEPLVIVLIGAAIGQRVSRAALTGVSVGFVGVTILILPGASSGGSGLVGTLLVLAASISWAAGSVSSTRVRLPADLGLSTALQMIAGGGVMIVAGLTGGEGGQLDPSGFSAGSVVAFVYLVVFGSIVAFTAYTWLLRHVEISRVSTYAYVNPMIAVVLGWAVLGEAISAATLVGASVIVASVAFIVRSTRSAAPPERKGAEDRPMVATARRPV